MHDDLTNLLPHDRRRARSREYLLRLLVVAASFVSGLTIVAAALLVPTYLLLSSNATQREQELAKQAPALSTGEETSLAQRLSALAANASALVKLSSASSVTGTLRSVLDLPRPGITLTTFTYTPRADAKKPATLLLSGIAATREALRSYQLALENASFTKSAALPVSSYANDVNIAFTITLTLTP